MGNSFTKKHLDLLQQVQRFKWCWVTPSWPACQLKAGCSNHNWDRTLGMREKKEAN